jgi:hypothetical protein
VPKNTEILLVNCNNVIDVDDHFIDPLSSFLKDTKKSIIFFSNDNKSTLVKYLDELYLSSDSDRIKISSSGVTRSFYINNHKLSEENVTKLIEKAERLEKDWIIKQVAKSFTEFADPKPLSSTPLMAPGEFNATRIISDPYLFRWLSILMAESILKIIQKGQIRTYNIIAVSLRGAVIAAAVWELLNFLSNPKLHIVDHMGPRHQIIEYPLKNNKFNNEYCIYIGDFIIAGPEVKVANTYCNLLGGKIHHAFVLGKYIKQEDLGRDIQLHALVNLKECINSLSYEVS